MRKLEGRTAVVVHVGSPLGKACASRLSEDGAEVVVVDPIEQSAEEAVREIVEAGGRAGSVVAGFGDESAIARVAEEVAERFSRIDVLVVAAGALDWWPADQDSMANWEASLRINLLTPVFYVRAFRELLSRSGDASVVIYGSIDGVRGNPRVPAYSAARGALIPFVHTEAHELASLGIRVNLVAGAAILPHGPEAPLDRGAFVDSAVAMRDTPLARLARPADVAGVVSFLAGPDSAYVTGTVVTLDGGRTAITPGTGLNLAE